MYRRDFLKMSGAAGFGLAAQWGCSAPAPSPPGADATERDLARLAIDEAMAAGAAYADVRVQHQWTESVATREEQITGVSYADSFIVRELQFNEIANTSRRATKATRSLVHGFQRGL